MQRHQHLTRCLRLWEEAYGTPTELAVEQDQGVVCLEMGENTLVFPLGMEHKLRPFMGRRIGIIRTDLLDEEYIVRVIDEAPLTSLASATGLEKVRAL